MNRPGTPIDNTRKDIIMSNTDSAMVAEIMDKMQEARRDEKARLLRNIIIGLVLFSLVAMFAGSFIYRLGHPSLVKKSRVTERAEAQSAGLGGSAMGVSASPEVMQHIAELMGNLKDNPNSFDLRMELGEHFIEITNWKSAITHLERAAALQADSAKAFSLLGYSHFRLEEYAEAAENYAKAVQLDGDANSKLNLAYIYKNFLNREAEAVKLFNEIIAAPETEEDLRGIAEQLLEANVE